MIREATHEDLAAILEIYNHAIIHTTAVYSYHPQTLEERKAWFRSKQQFNWPVFVEDIEGVVAGFATYGPFRDWPAYQYTVEHSIYVHPEYRGRKIGKRLLHSVLQDAKGRGMKTMVAGIDATNDASIRLHSQLGFQHNGTIRKAGFKFDRWLDLAFMQYIYEDDEGSLL
ncbi:N-acetyltransferase [Pontibacillus halophilus JSM 076056 = DSM 19796]|uniref:N-acetyltransferase n=1 Tax=Pontibacillus halophilus JSM 076056 = DSM 19796 TaxID=1385510 RepID=A0A0A5GJF9_9BACI|nr:GNAT family N-acetyltransferase [Pontibacillus halophilus]KGX91353.1 N-acetyltransferase [Pontibacillus halophilus JSM 076056 = DSM 19796]